MSGRLCFDSIREHSPGVIADLLRRSHAELLDADPEHWSGEALDWVQYDRDAFVDPDTVGACIFITCLGREPIGLGSWEPRGNGRGQVGHNCIVPEHRGHGYGTHQLREIVHRMQRQGLGDIRVTTCEHPFFLPARRMYQSCGFLETGRRDGRPDPDWRLVDYAFSAPEDLD